MKSLVSILIIFLFPVFIFSQCQNIYMAPLSKVIKVDSNLSNWGSAYWVCENLTIEISGKGSKSYIEKNCMVTVSDNHNFVFVKGPGNLTINSDSGTYRIDSTVILVNNGIDNNITICSLGNEVSFDYSGLIDSTVTDCLDTSSTSTFVKKLNQTSFVRLFPNPTNDYLNIEYKGDFTSISYTLYDLSGKIIFQGSIDKGVSVVDVSILKPGLYFIQLENDNINLNKQILIR